MVEIHTHGREAIGDRPLFGGVATRELEMNEKFRFSHHRPIKYNNIACLRGQADYTHSLAEHTSPKVLEVSMGRPPIGSMIMTQQACRLFCVAYQTKRTKASGSQRVVVPSDLHQFQTLNSSH